MAFAKLKALLRARAVRTIDALWRAIGEICDLFRALSGLTESRGIPKAARVRFNLLAFDWRPAGMARAYSLDLRERVVGAVAAGQTCRSVAKTFMVSVASVVKWSQRQRAVGGPAALKMGGHRPYLVARERDWVLARISSAATISSSLRS
jgi:hypothetical protein